MADSIGEIYVEFAAKADKLTQQINSIQRDTENSARKIEDDFKKTKLSLDTSLANQSLKQLQQTQKALQAQFDNKLKLNADDASISKTENALRAVRERIEEIKSGVSGSGSSGGGGFFSNMFSNISEQASGMVSTFAGIAAGIFTATKAMELFKSSIEAAEARDKALRGIDATIHSMGREAEYSSESILKMASGLASVNKNSVKVNDIMNMQAYLMTFDSMSKDIMPRASQVVIDLAAKMGTDLTSAARSVGIALEDPEGGLNRLRRAGVVFTDQQKEVIKAMVETGNKAQAQAEIFKVLESKVGGYAAATTTDLEAMENRFSVFTAKIKRSIGEILLGGGEELLTWLNNINQYGAAGAVSMRDLGNAMEVAASAARQLAEVNAGAITASGQKAERDAAKLTNEQIRENIKLTEKKIELLKKVPLPYADQQNDIQQQEEYAKALQGVIDKRAILAKAGKKEKEGKGEKSTTDADLSKYYSKLQWEDDNYEQYLKDNLDKEIANMSDAAKKQIDIALYKSEKLKEIEESRLKWEKENQDKVFLKSGGLISNGDISASQSANRYNSVNKKGENNSGQKIINDYVGIDGQMSPIDNKNNEEQAKAGFNTALKDSEKLKDTWVQIGDSLANAGIEQFSGGIAKAVIEGQSLNEVFKNIGASLAEMAVQMVMMSALKSVFAGPLGFLGIGAHTGGEFVGTSSGVMKMAMGGSFIVPPGYNNDSFPLMVESGERVSVTPANQVNSQQINFSALQSEMAGVKNSIRVLNSNLINKNMNVAVFNSSPDVRTQVVTNNKNNNLYAKSGLQLDKL